MGKKTGIGADINDKNTRIIRSDRASKAVEDLLEAIELDTIDAMKEHGEKDTLAIMRTMHEFMIATTARLNEHYLAKWEGTIMKVNKRVRMDDHD